MQRLRPAFGALRPLILCLALGAALVPGAVRADDRAAYIGSYNWQDPRRGFGGFSGIELSQDGLSALVLSDRAYLLEAQISRDGEGRITGVTSGPGIALKDSKGAPLTGRNADSEGITFLPDGRFCVSFEINSRISCYAAPDAAAELLPRHPDFAGMIFNSSLEALAADAEGTLYTLPEDVRKGADFPVYRFRDGIWDRPFTVIRRGDFLPVGADIGPDGRFYLLERRFSLPTGFSSRVRRYDLTDKGLQNETVLLQSRPLQHGNLEGISVWRDDRGRIRLTLIADNNQMRLFQNEIAEYFVD